MRCFNHGRFREQARFLKHPFLQDGGLPFGDILADDFVVQARRQRALTDPGSLECFAGPLKR